MTYTVSITSQGQINIPAQIRRQLGLSKNSKAILSLNKGEISIRPVKDFLELRGSLKTNKRSLSNERLHDMFAQEMSREAVEE